MIRRISSLVRSTEGSTMVEFAVVAPVLLLMIVGFFDLSRSSYVRSTLQGAIQKAGRDGTLQSPNLSSLNAKVEAQVRPIAGANATFSSTWKSYASFGKVGAREALTDTNGNNQRDAGECFTDENGNGSWDADLGLTGSGGASDVVLYTVSVSYARLLPLDKMLGWSANQTVSASTVLRNQPWQSQSTTAAALICTP